MAFKVEVRESSDRVVATCELGPELSRWLPDYRDVGFPVLRFIDEYGDTFLNALQVRHLVIELEALRERIDDANALESLEQLAELAAVALQEPHRFLVLIGD